MSVLETYNHYISIAKWITLDSWMWNYTYINIDYCIFNWIVSLSLYFISFYDSSMIVFFITVATNNTRTSSKHNFYFYVF